MISSEAAAENAQIVTARRALYVGHQFVVQVTIVLRVARGSQRRRCPVVVPALGIDRINAKQLNEALLDFVGEPPNGVHVLVLMKTAHRRRKSHDAETAIAE